MQLTFRKLRSLIAEGLKRPQKVKWKGPNGWVEVEYVRPAGALADDETSFDPDQAYHFIIRPGTQGEWPVHKSQLDFGEVSSGPSPVAVDLVDQYASVLPSGIGKMIGHGMDGEVYEFGANQVIKVGSDAAEFVDRVERTVKIMANDDDFVTIRDFGRAAVDKKEVYWIVMDRLVPLSPDERELTAGLLGDFHYGRPKNAQIERLRHRFAQHRQLFSFLLRVVMKLSDRTNPDNIMMTVAGDYKVIDPEGLEVMWQ